MVIERIPFRAKLEASTAWNPVTRPRVVFTSSGRPGPWSRWSYHSMPASRTLRCDASGRTTLADRDGTLRTWDDPLDALYWLGSQVERSSAARGGPPFKGGWAGFISYDAGRLFENLPARDKPDLGLPLFDFAYYPEVIAADHLSREAWRIRLDDAPRVGPAVEFHPSQLLDPPPALSAVNTRGEFEAGVTRAIEYIRAGDIFQVNLSQRFTVGQNRGDADIHGAALMRSNAWYGAFVAAKDYALVSLSPELFLRVEPMPDGKRRAITRPIKGTRPAGPGMRDALARSEKDTAELNMIIDLERNDLGRVCEIGSVRVAERRHVERHPTVYHGVATVEGVLRDDVTFVDLLRATFPGGSITGAPKIRAMEIIDELEPVRRGPYCGAIGFLSCDGHAEFNIAIRTMIVKDGLVHLSVGGGIVADSDPAAEYEETLVKARAMFDVLGVRL